MDAGHDPARPYFADRPRRTLDGLMLEGLYSAAAGMQAQQTQLDAISNDLANLSTDGYQSERVAFSDLLYNKVDQAGTETTAGAGASATIAGRNQTQGALKETGNPLDLAIEGSGYFLLTRPDGSKALTRDGDFQLNADGSITNGDGDHLSPPIKVPAGTPANEIHIAPDGTVSLGAKKLGKIGLVTVTSPDHLSGAGGGLLIPSAASGEPQAFSAGKVHQGALEESNVDVGKDMASMMSTERAFQLTSSAIQTESQMMTIANQLRST
jgi:flagellar basal-body rod protein FlgG